MLNTNGARLLSQQLGDLVGRIIALRPQKISYVPRSTATFLPWSLLPSNGARNVQPNITSLR